MPEISANVLVTKAYGEDNLPRRLLDEGKEQGISYTISEKPLEDVELSGYTALFIHNLKKSMSQKGADTLSRFVDDYGGIFLTASFYNQAQVERFSQAPRQLISSIFGAELLTKKYSPNFTVDPGHGSTFEDNSLFNRKIRVNRTFDLPARTFPLKLMVLGHTIFSWFPRIEPDFDESEEEIIAYLSCLEKWDGKVFLERHLDYNNLSEISFTEEHDGKEFRITNDSKALLYSAAMLDVHFKYTNVGITTPSSSPGRGICIVSHKPFSAIDDPEYKTIEIISGCLKWISELRKGSIKQKIEDLGKDLVPKETSFPSTSELFLTPIPKFTDVLDRLEGLADNELPAKIGLKRPVSDIKKEFEGIKRNLTTYLFSVVGVEKRDGLTEDEEDIWRTTLDLGKLLKNKRSDEKLTEDEMQTFTQFSYNIGEFARSQKKEQTTSTSI